MTYKNEILPKAFEGYRIVQISDLHNKTFGNGQEKLLAKKLSIIQLLLP